MNERARPKAFAAAKRPAQAENAPAAAKIGVLLINLGTPDDDHVLGRCAATSRSFSRTAASSRRTACCGGSS